MKSFITSSSQFTCFTGYYLPHIIFKTMPLFERNEWLTESNMVLHFQQCPVLHASYGDERHLQMEDLPPWRNIVFLTLYQKNGIVSHSKA